MFCHKCGKQLPDDAAFCSGCGSPVRPPEPQPVSVAARPQDAPAVRPQGAPAVRPQGVPAVRPQEPAPENTFAISSPFTEELPEEPQRSPEKEKPVKSRSPESSAAKVLKTVFSVISCVILTVSAIAASAITTVRGIGSKESVESIISDADLCELRIIVDGVDYSLLEYVSENNSYNEDLTPSEARKKTRKFIEKPFVKLMLAEAVEEYRAYFFDGKAAYGQDAGTVVEMIMNYEKQIVKAVNEYTDDDNYLIYDTIREDVEGYIGDMYTISGLERDIALLPLARTIVAQWSQIVMWVVCGCFVALLIVLNLRNIGKGLQYIGISAAITGIFLLAAAIVSRTVINMTFISEMNITLDTHINALLLAGGIVTGAAIVFIAAGGLLKRYINNRG